MLDFKRSEEQEQLIATARRFAKERIIPVAAEADRKAEFPSGIVDFKFPDGEGVVLLEAFLLVDATTNAGIATAGAAGAVITSLVSPTTRLSARVTSDSRRAGSWRR